MEEKVLIHHGIDGQKWGKRNGPPYPLSRQKRGNKKTRFIDSVKSMSDVELDSRNNRLQKEKRYINLVNDPAFDTSGYVSKLLKSMANQYITSASMNIATSLGKETSDLVMSGLKNAVIESGPKSKTKIKK